MADGVVIAKMDSAAFHAGVQVFYFALSSYTPSQSLAGGVFRYALQR